MAEIFALDTLLQLAHHYGYGVILAGILLENAGIPLPGETLTLIGGFLAGNGELSYGGVLLSAIGGAIIGDSCGYWLGRWGGLPLVTKIAHWFAIPPGHVERELPCQCRSGGPVGQICGAVADICRSFGGYCGYELPPFFAL